MVSLKKPIKYKKQFDPFKNLVLDEYEKEIETSIARDEWKPVENIREIRKMWKEAARRHKELNKSKKVTFRIKQGDLIKLRAKAKRTSIPYQTLLGVLIRNFVEGDYSVKL